MANKTISEMPKIGVSMIVRNGPYILLGERMKKFGQGQLSLPGGHLEMFETTEFAARRETKEECGLAVGKTTLIGFTEDFYPKEKKHYLTVFYIGEYIGGEIIETEPDKIGNWQWYDISNLTEIQNDLWQPCIEKFKMLGWL